MPATVIVTHMGYVGDIVVQIIYRATLEYIARLNDGLYIYISSGRYQEKINSRKGGIEWMVPTR